MFSLDRRYWIVLSSGLILGSLLFGLTRLTPARADVGVQPILPGGSSIEPDGQTPIVMAAEVITMNVRLATEADNAIVQLNPEAYGLQFKPVWYKLVAEVQVEFSMDNPSAEVVSQTTWFPLASSLSSVSWELNPDEIVPRITSFEVQVDGRPLDYTTLELPNPQGADKPLLPWASFPVSFAAGTHTSIHVSYLLPLPRAVKGSELALNYIFQTGAGWAGPIGKAELIINLPHPSPRLEEAIVRVDPDHPDQPYHGQEYYFLDPDARHVHWILGSFEPTPQDDFFAWLIDPDLRQAMEDSWWPIVADQENGQAYLIQGSRCLDIAIKAYNIPSIFFEGYWEMCQNAYMIAENYLPDHPAPYIGLASVLLAEIIADPEVFSDMIYQVTDQLEIAKELEQAHPEWVNEDDLTIGMVEDALSIYSAKATATAQVYATSTAGANQTEAATMIIPASMTPSPQPSLTPTGQPSALAHTRHSQAHCEPPGRVGGHAHRRADCAHDHRRRFHCSDHPGVAHICPKTW